MKIKVKLENCERIFNQKQLLLTELKQIEMMIHDQYGIVQNDGVEVDLFDLTALESSVDMIDGRLNDFGKKWHTHIGAIYDHVLKCHTNE